MWKSSMVSGSFQAYGILNYNVGLGVNLTYSRACVFLENNFP